MVADKQCRTSRVIRSWARIYDLVNFFVYLLFGGTKRLHSDIISMSQVKDMDTVLDIGCGTGEFLIELTKRYNNINAYGIDASEEMISIANQKAQKTGCKRLSFKLAGAERLPYEDNMFDCTSSIFILHHLPMELKLKSLYEAYRVLRPGGQFILVDIDRPTTTLGRLIGSTRAYISEIKENMQQPLMDLLKKAGFCSIEHLRKDHGIFSFIRSKK